MILEICNGSKICGGNMQNNIAANMREIICQAIDLQNYYEAYEALIIYVKTFSSNDNFVERNEWLVNEYGPQVSVICLDNKENSIDKFIESQNYKNIELVKLSEEDSYTDIIEYMKSTDSKYICFWEDNYQYDDCKISDMVWEIECSEQFDVVMSPRMYVDTVGNIIGHKDYAYENTFKNVIVKGDMLINYCIDNDINLYGSLSNILLNKKCVYSMQNKCIYKSDAINRLCMLFQIITSEKIFYMEKSLVRVKMSPRRDENVENYEYRQLVSNINCDELTSMNNICKLPKLKKEITFFYTSKGEYYNLKPIADTAANRGYKIKFTKDKKEKAEIGVYCQHVCYPENSRFSLILLHDLAQGHNRWPNLWENERWNGFDIGIVPGKSWADRWRKCACFYYANPRCGTFEFGYPKSDCINDIGILNRGAEVKKLLAMPDRFTVLYAPSWENDNKEDDFIKSLQNLDINLMVKQAAWPEVYQHIRGNIEYMRSIHEGRFENLYYIEPEESIMTALSLCDMVVSDESSVMAEALMFGKPSVAVTDWMIPDEDPPRPASVPMDYVIKCEKKDLREKVLSIMNHSEEYEDILQKGRDTFSNQGNVCKDIMDAIDYYTQGGTEDSFMSRKLESEYRAFNMWN